MTAKDIEALQKAVYDIETVRRDLQEAGLITEANKVDQLRADLIADLNYEVRKFNEKED
jgi:hypothetical protein